MPITRAVWFVFAGLVMAGGCTAKIEKDSADNGDSAGSIRVAFGDDAAHDLKLAKGDVRIVSTDGVLVLSLIGDTVRMQLSDSLRNSVGAEIAKDADTSGIGGMIAKTVSKAVTGAMGFMVRVPATDIENLRFEDGRIRFEIRNSDTKVKMNNNSNEDAVFAEDDARRFIDAVKKRAARAVAM